MKDKKYKEFDKKSNEDYEERVNSGLEEKYEVGEDSTKYGEFISSYFSWLTLDTQKKLAKRMENMTKK